MLLARSPDRALSERAERPLKSCIVTQQNAPRTRLRTICLVMIVRNEAAIIRRCLDSVKGIISHWVICDTGSTDGTPEIILDHLKGIPGAVHQTLWIDFGHNRTQALKLAKGKADYHLLLDADMTLKVNGEFRDKLTA